MKHDWHEVLSRLEHLLEIRDREAKVLIHSADITGIKHRIKKLKDKLVKSVGIDFERCPLHSEVVESIHMNGYTIENVVIQSLPGYYVPINVYVPVKKSKHPAVLVSMGHYIEGKQLAENQIMCANLAKKGFLAATYDPVCQGERDMYPERTEQWYRKDMWVVEEHMRIGHQSYALGESSAKYFIWDGMRVLDYICTRPDTDPERIGCTGQSGGGTASYYLAALDDRVKAAVPIHCLSKQEMILKNNKIGDPEQTIFALWDGFAFDHPDFLWLAAPKPVLVIAGLRDYFYIEGVRKIEQEISELYRHMGCKDKFGVAEVDSEHYISREVRLQCYHWFERWLKGSKGSCSEDEVMILPYERLCCLGGIKENKTALDINLQRIQGIRAAWEKPEDVSAFIKDIKDLLRLEEGSYQVNAILKETTVEFTVEPENGYPTRCTLYKGKCGKPLIVFIDFCSRFDETLVIKSFGDCSILFVKPFAVETTSVKSGFSYDQETVLAYANFFTGGSMFARRTESLLSAFNEALRITGNKNIAAVCGSGQGAHIAMAAALYDERVSNVLAFEGIGSLDSIFEGSDFFIAESSIIPGLAGRYDTADMMAALGDRMLVFINPLNSFQKPVPTCTLKDEYDTIAARYGGNCRIEDLPFDRYIGFIKSILRKRVRTCASLF